MRVSALWSRLGSATGALPLLRVVRLPSPPTFHAGNLQILATPLAKSPMRRLDRWSAQIGNWTPPARSATAAPSSSLTANPASVAAAQRLCRCSPVAHRTANGDRWLWSGDGGGGDCAITRQRLLYCMPSHRETLHTVACEPTSRPSGWMTHWWRCRAAARISASLNDLVYGYWSLCRRRNTSTNLPAGQVYTPSVTT